MKKLISSILLMTAMVAAQASASEGGGQVAANQSVTIQRTDFTNGGTNEVIATKSPVTVTISGKNVQNNTSYDWDYFRYYTNSDITVKVPEGYSLSSIVFTHTGTNYVKFPTNWTGVGTLSTSGVVVTWTAGAESTNSVSFKTTDTGRCSNVVVTYTGGTGESGGEEPTPEPEPEPEPELTGEVFTLLTDVSKLAEGKSILIVNTEAQKALGPNSTSGNNRTAELVTFTESKITPKVGEKHQVITLVQSFENDGEWYLEVEKDNVGKSQYLYAGSSSRNQLKTGGMDMAGNSSCTIAINSDGNATITFTGPNTCNLVQYNPQNSIFACYGSANQQPVQIYILDDGTSTEPEPEPEPDPQPDPTPDPVKLGEPVYTINGDQVTVTVENADLIGYTYFYRDDTKTDVEDKVEASSFTFTVDGIGLLEITAIAEETGVEAVEDSQSFYYEATEGGAEEWRLVESKDALTEGSELVIGTKNICTTGGQDWNYLAAVSTSTKRFGSVSGNYSSDRTTVTWTESDSPYIFTLGKSTNTDFPFTLKKEDKFVYAGGANTDLDLQDAEDNQAQFSIVIEEDNTAVIKVAANKEAVTQDPEKKEREILLNNTGVFRNYVSENRTHSDHNAVALYKKQGGRSVLVDRAFVMAPIRVDDKGERLAYSGEALTENDVVYFRCESAATVYYRWEDVNTQVESPAKAAPNTPMTESDMTNAGWTKNESTETPNVLKVTVPAIADGQTKHLKVAALHGEYGMSDTVTLSTGGMVVGIESVEAEADAPAVYYNLQGMRIDRPAAGTIAIKQQGTKVSKVLF